jgi:RNA polymerase sigma-70 factor (ECF subfamily)
MRDPRDRPDDHLPPSRECAIKVSEKQKDDLLLSAARAGDEASFAELVTRHERSMIRVALAYVGDLAAAEEVVQETWLAVVKGLKGFKQRSSFRTWLFSILMNQARKRAARRFKESSEESRHAESEDPTSELFDVAGEWGSKPSAWGSTPESELLAKEAVDQIHNAISSLPDKQRIIITLRDLESWTSEEVCNLMKITKTNQRVLLHFARSKVQQALDGYFAGRRKASAGQGPEGLTQ